MEPSAYFRRQCYITFEDDEIGMRTRDIIGVPNLVWGNDYPHHDSIWPKSMEVLQRIMQGVPDDERGWEAAANQAAYAVAKAGIMAFTRAVTAEVARKGIRVNAVAPSFSPNPFLERIYPKEMLDAFEKHSMLGRGAAPSEIANVILFLVSDLSSYMTGEVLSVSSQHA